MGEEQSTVSGGGGPQEAKISAGDAAGHPEPPRPRGDSSGAPRSRADSAEPSGSGCGSNSGCADTSAPEPARTRGALGWRKSQAPGQPAGLALAGPLKPQTLQQQLEEEEEAGDRTEGGDEQHEAPPSEEPESRIRVGLPDGLVLDVLGPRRPPPAKRHVFCSVYCVENDLPEASATEQLSPPASPPPVPMPSPSSPPASFPSPRLSLPTDPLSSDGGSIELEFYLASEAFSVPSLLGAPPYSGLGGVGDPYAPLMVLMCRVCLEDKPIKPLPCCKKAVCEECLKVYLSSQVQLGQVEIKCPITECFEFLEETTVIYNLTHEDSIKYKYFLELGRIDSSTKPCPQCKHFTTFKKKGHIPTPSRSESKYKVENAENIEEERTGEIEKASMKRKHVKLSLEMLNLPSWERSSAPLANLSGVLSATLLGMKVLTARSIKKETNYCATGPAKLSMGRGMPRSVQSARSTSREPKDVTI
ncbi:E3 ubiquitin-protein ligase RNF217 isoform X2 [Elephas maximus indicus]|uniref:E3 ubiquitin-protein ligase RNF217 isoform X2 n=1 Tax=Elephas maximus indicus TaxID=99487 RepID=UPI002116DD9B|nr:E3 ubiquitin-protein ligase RNF217 isoform X2 [Elephas maximus indicus]